MTLQKMTLPSVIQHLQETTEGYSHELIFDTYFKTEVQCITFPLSLVMVMNLFGHNKTNFPTLKFGKWSVHRVKPIKSNIFAVL